MPELLLVRHAKAAPFGVEPGDHGRPLAEKGRMHAGLLGGMLRASNCQPTQALVSTAQRTRETLTGMNLSPEPQTLYSEDLYLAAAEDIEREIWREIHDTERLAVIAHNPGLGLLAWQWLQASSGHDAPGAQKLRHAFKTGYTAWFDWNEGRPILKALYDPRKASA